MCADANLLQPVSNIAQLGNKGKINHISAYSRAPTRSGKLENSGIPKYFSRLGKINSLENHGNYLLVWKKSGNLQKPF